MVAVPKVQTNGQSFSIHKAEDYTPALSARFRLLIPTCLALGLESPFDYFCTRRNIRNMTKTILWTLLAAIFPAGVNAATISYAFSGIGPVGFNPPNEGQTYAGNGMVTMHDTDGPDINRANYFDQRFFITTPYTRNVLQHEISELKGSVISSAILTVSLHRGTDRSGMFPIDSTVTKPAIVEGYQADGVLSSADFVSPSLGQATGFLGMGTHSINVTSLVATQVNSGNDWLGLRVYGNTGDYPRFWGYSIEPFTPEFKVTVTLDIVTVPDEGASAILLLMAGGAVLLFRRHSRSMIPPPR